MKSFFKTLLAAFIGSLAALMIAGFIAIGLIGALVSLGQSSESTTLPSESILRLDLSKPIAERSSDDPFSSISLTSFKVSEQATSILSAVSAIEKAASDPRISFIYINADNPVLGMSALEEVRAALQKFRESGKPIIAYATNFSQSSYYIASVADKIYMNGAGSVYITGISMNMLFFKGLLDKLGIDVQLIRHGKFKSYAEQYTSTTISKENREQNQVMMDEIWESWTSAICEKREITPAQFNKLVNNLSLSNAESMLNNNLIDEVVTEQQMIDNLCTLASKEDEKDLKFTSLAKYAKAAVTPNYKAKDRIAVIYAEGEITMNGSNGIAASSICPVIKKVAKDSTIKGVVLRVNSPGGDATAADIINNELQNLRAKKPVVVSFGDYAASGGYWISACSDHIFTNRTTLTGSIGVFSMAMNYGKLLDKHLDINPIALKTHAHSDIFSGTRNLDAAEIEYFRGTVEDIYTQFIELVAEGRELPVKYVDSVGQGRVWAGSMAKNLKLADSIGGIKEAITYTSHLVGTDDYQIVEYPYLESSVDKFLKMIEGSSSVISLSPVEAIERSYSYLKGEKGVQTLARMPYIYEFSY